MTINIERRELHGKRLIGYASGNFGLSLVNIFTGTFIFQFYVYTINLSSILVSVGLIINSILIAIFAILSGVIVDNKKPTKRGKRKIFLIIGIPIWFLANIFLWLPPWYCPFLVHDKYKSSIWNFNIHYISIYASRTISNIRK